MPRREFTKETGLEIIASAEATTDDDFARFLSGDNSKLKCTICSAPHGTCDCWNQCLCGWSYRKGERCRNPIHKTKRNRK